MALAPSVTPSRAAPPAPAETRLDLLNVFAGAITFVSDHHLEIGARVIAMLGGDNAAGKLTLEVTQCVAERVGRYHIRGRLVDGAASARLVYCF